jgi:hypothetical protein
MVLSDYLNRYVLPRHFIRVSRFANTSIFFAVSFDLVGHVSVILPNKQLCWTMTSCSIVSGNAFIIATKSDDSVKHCDSSGSGKAVLNVGKAVLNEAPAGNSLRSYYTTARLGVGCTIIFHATLYSVKPY